MGEILCPGGTNASYIAIKLTPHVVNSVLFEGKQRTVRAKQCKRSLWSPGKSPHVPKDPDNPLTRLCLDFCAPQHLQRDVSNFKFILPPSNVIFSCSRGHTRMQRRISFGNITHYVHVRSCCRGWIVFYKF